MRATEKVHIGGNVYVWRYPYYVVPDDVETDIIPCGSIEDAKAKQHAFKVLYGKSSGIYRMEQS